MIPTNRGSGIGTLVLAILVVTSVSVAFAGVSGGTLAETKKADVVFVFDKTGSMDDEAAALKDEIKSVAADLESRGIDARYALIEYEDASTTEIIDFDPESDGTQAFTSDTAALAGALEEFTTGGGTEDASNAIDEALGLDTRDDAKQIVVVLTDEDDDGYTDQNEDGEADIVDKVNEAGACLLAVSPDEVDTDPADQLKTYSNLVECGDWSDILSESFSTVVQDLVTFIDESVDEVTESEETESVPSPRFVVDERSIESAELYTNETANVTYEVRNVGSADGQYHAVLYDNDRVLASERVTLHSGENHTFRWQVSWATVGKRDLSTQERYIERVDVVERPTPPLDPADVELVDASTVRSKVLPGETYEVTASVRNNGTTEGKTPVAFAADETEQGNDSVTIQAGETVDATYTATAGSPTAPGNVSWTVNGVHADNVTVLDPNETESGIVDVYTTREIVSTGETYEVVPVLYNGGATEQYFVVTFSRVNETGVTMMYVSVAPGETLELPHSVSAPETVGTDQWVVSGATAPTVTVTNATG